MFMFRNRKNALVKQALKYRQTVLGNHPDAKRKRAARQVKLAAKQLLMCFSEPQLELLISSLESSGGDPGQCVLLGRDVAEDRPGSEVPLQLLVLWLWRWPDLPDNAPLARLPSCNGRNDSVYVCANPYHWARLYDPGPTGDPGESPPPPYSRFNVDLLRPEDAAPSQDRSRLVESQETGGTNQYATYSTNGTGSIPWCQVAYWEGRDRVGRMYPVCTPSLNIMGDTPQGNGLSLTSLAANSHNSPSEQVKKTREKIGSGLVLYLEGKRVWIYNRAEVPLFITSPTLDGGLHTRSQYIVHKLLPGHIINSFDYDTARRYQKLPLHPDLRQEGPIDQNTVRVSFAKGWGPTYHRQEISECPCWLELLLVPAR